MGDNNEALGLINKAVEIDPENPIYCNNLGTAFREADELDKAFLYFQKAIDLKPDFPEAHNNMGVCLKTTGKPEEAKEAFRTALQFHPQDYDIRAKLRELEGKPYVFSHFDYGTP